MGLPKEKEFVTKDTMKKDAIKEEAVNFKKLRNPLKMINQMQFKPKPRLPPPSVTISKNRIPEVQEIIDSIDPSSIETSSRISVSKYESRNKSCCEHTKKADSS